MTKPTEEQCRRLVVWLFFGNDELKRKVDFETVTFTTADDVRLLTDKLDDRKFTLAEFTVWAEEFGVGDVEDWLKLKPAEQALKILDFLESIGKDGGETE